MIPMTDSDQLYYLIPMLIALLLGVVAVVHQYWIERGREEFDEFIDGFINGF